MTRISNIGGGSSGSTPVASALYTPATVVIAPVGYVHKADYYTDGINDNVEIEAALASLSSTGGKVLLRPGTYYMNGTVDVYSNTELCGEGQSTILFYQNGTVNSRILLRNADQTNGNTGIFLHDFTINGNYPTELGTPTRNQVYLFHSTNCIVSNLNIINAPDSSIVLDGGSDNIVSHNFIDTTADIGIYVSGSNNNIITENNIQGSASYGIRLRNGSQSNTVSNNFLYNCGTTGQPSIIVMESSEQNLISSNYVSTSGLTGIDINNSAYTSVVGNYVELSQREGIKIDTISRGLITGNVTHRNSQAAGNTYSGIVLNSASNCVVSGNRSGDIGSGTRQKYGIEEGGTSDYNSITGNMLERNGTGGLHVVGSHTEVGHNNVAISGSVSNSHSGFTALSQIDMNSNNIVNLLDPISAQDAATRNYVDSVNFINTFTFMGA